MRRMTDAATLASAEDLAKTRAIREGRSIPFSALAGDDEADPIDPEGFQAAGESDQGAWRTGPGDWSGMPEDRLIGLETLGRIRRAIDGLPPMQAEVIRLRDVLGWTSEEVRNALDLSETNQRVLLHRARSRVRRALDEYFQSEMGA